MYTKAIKGWLKHWDFIVVDVLSMEISLMIAYVIRFGWGWSHQVTIYKTLMCLVPVLHICIVFFAEEYSGVLRRGYIREIKAVIQHSMVIYALLFFYMFVVQKGQSYSRGMLLISLLISMTLTYVARCGLKQLLYKSYKHNMEKLNQLILVTQKSLLEESVMNLQRNKYANYTISGISVIDDEMIGDTYMGIPIISDGDKLIDYALTNIVDEVLFNTTEQYERVDEITNKLLDMGIIVHINLDRVSDKLPNKVVEKLSDFTVMTTSINMATVRQLAIKRVMDIVGSIIGLIGTGLLFIVFAPIIYIQSPGPVFFSQYRVGRNGRLFKIYKFRSMYMDAEERKQELMKQNKMNGLMFKMDDDPRIIPIGKFIRATSIDEFPQFWNVLKGDMSLVGTRPPTVDEYEKYELHHKRRLATKPGITGMWQVSGRSDITDFEEVVKLDSEYITNWSLSMDIKILWKTVSAVLCRSGSV